MVLDRYLALDHTLSSIRVGIGRGKLGRCIPNGNASTFVGIVGQTDTNMAKNKVNLKKKKH